MKTLRIIRGSKYPAPKGLAIDEALFKSVEEGLVPETVRFYYFAPPAVVVGLNQDINLINLKYLRENNMSFGRRLTGGGAIIIGCPEYSSQMGITFLVRLNSELPEKLSHKFKLLSSVVMYALKDLGLQPKYNRNSDITIDGKKIVGSGIYMSENTLLFHSIILFDYDFETMYNVLNLTEPAEKIIPMMQNQITTLNYELNRKISTKIVEDLLISGIESLWQCEVTEGNLEAGEKKMANTLYQEKYNTNSWNFQSLDNEGLRSACFIPVERDFD